MKFNYTVLIISIIIIVFLLVLYSKTYENFVVTFSNRPTQFANCSSISNCATCAETFGCVYCKTSNKCVSDLSRNALCPREDTAASIEGCGADNSTTTTEYKQRTYGDCSGASDCKNCLSSPGCYWCDTKKVCISSIGVYDRCNDDPVIKNSFSECDAANRTTYNPNEFNIPRTINSIPRISEDSITVNSRNQLGSSTTAIAGSMTPIIPIVALTKDLDGNLTQASLQTIIDSMKRDGYNFTTVDGKEKALEVIEIQRNQLRQNYKNTMKDYLLNSLEYISDGASLNRAKDIDSKIKELDDLSRYIQTMKLEGFIEGFLDTNLSKEITINENLMEKNGETKVMTQYLWLANIVALGTFLYIR